MSDEQRAQTLDDVIASEKNLIRLRRETLGLSEKGNTSELDTVGLAFSGGGIRSATFNLGILQGLANLGLLKYFDYLSTVSGGGYIGSWLTAWIQRDGSLKDVEKKLDPDWAAQQSERSEEPAQIKYLRRHSNYLAPRIGALSADTWVLWASYLRNFLLNQLLLFPTILAILLVTRIVLVLYHPETMWKARYWPIIPFAAGGEDTDSVTMFFLVYRGAIIGLIGLLWFLACFFAFLGSGRVRLAEAKGPDETGPAPSLPAQPAAPPSLNSTPQTEGKNSRVGQLTPAKLAMRIIAPLVLASLLFCFLPASRPPDALTTTAAAGFDWKRIIAFITVPAVLSVLAYILALCRRERWLDSRWHLLAIVAAAILGGLALHFVHHFLEWLAQVGPWEVGDYVKARAAARITTFGPPLVLAVVTSIIFLGIAILRHRIGEELREWWSSVCARLLLFMAGWLAVTGIAYYATSALIYAGPWFLTALGSSWFVAVASGILAAGSSVTGDERKSSSKLDFLARVAPLLFLVGVIVIISLAFPLIPHIGDERPDWTPLMSELETLKQLDPVMAPTKVSHVIVETSDREPSHERRFLEEHAEVLSDSEIKSYAYWMGMFHVPTDDRHTLTGVLSDPSVLWRQRAEDSLPDAERIESGYECPPSPFAGPLAKAKVPPPAPEGPPPKNKDEKQAPKVGASKVVKLSSRRIAQALIEHSGGMIDPAKIEKLSQNQNTEWTIEELRKALHSSSTQTAKGAPGAPGPKDDPKSVPTKVDHPGDDVAKDTTDSLTSLLNRSVESLNRAAEEWRPRIRFKLFPEDTRYLRSLSPDHHLAKDIEKMSNQWYSRECFDSLLASLHDRNKDEFKKLFRESSPIDVHETKRLMKRLALSPELISFSPGLLLLKYFLLLAACGLILLAASWCVDVNIFSLNALDGNRLTRAYLGASRPQPAKPEERLAAKPTTDGSGVMSEADPASEDKPKPKERQPDSLTSFDPADNMRLSDLTIGKSRNAFDQPYQGPHYLINAAINLVRSDDLSWQERQAASFVFTPEFSGSQLTGYRPTEKYAGGISLGEAVSISGAAASPNSGYHSSPAVSALLTMFNARMGAWLGNPGVAKTWQRRGPFMGYFHLLKELLGWTDSASPYVYLSDGGHFENLAVYELVRRRCRYIVVCDAGADPDYTFEDLGNLIRKVRIDFGIRIEIDHSSLRKATAKHQSSWHCAVGQVRYDDVNDGDIPGTLIYIKPSLSGDEPADVLQYARAHSAFPQEPTSDQFFSESQFESYRALGQHIAESVFEEAAVDLHQSNKDSPADHEQLCRVLFSSLSRRWFPMPPEYENHFAATTDDYSDLQKALAKDDRLKGLSDDIYPEIGATKEDGSHGTNSIELHTVLQLVQTMEKAWLGLNLDANYAHPLNRGWLDVFFRWTRSDAFRRTWPFVRSEFSERFVMFCEKQMRMGEVKVLTQSLSPEPPSDLIDEFHHQWPGLLATLTPRIVKIGEDALAWKLVPQMDDFPTTMACGFAMILRPSGKSDDRCIYELFLWIRGAYRNSGNGKKALRQLLSILRSRWSGEFVLQTKLPVRDVSGPGGKLLKRMWLTFYHNHGFRRLPRADASKDEIVLERTFAAINR